MEINIVFYYVYFLNYFLKSKVEKNKQDFVCLFFGNVYLMIFFRIVFLLNGQGYFGLFFYIVYFKFMYFFFMDKFFYFLF